MIATSCVVLVWLAQLFTPAGPTPPAVPTSPQARGAALPAELEDQLSDGEFVLGPAATDFRTRDYLASVGSSLTDYAAVINQWCAYASINPRVLLTVLEMLTGLVTGMQPVLAPSEPASAPLASQIERLAIDLASAFYGHLYSYGSRASTIPNTAPQILLAGGAAVPLTGRISSGSYAILSVLAGSSSAQQWQELSKPGDSNSFVAVYRRLFPGSDPLDNANSIDAPAAPPADLLQFPFPVGSTWWFNGPHNWHGNGAVYGRPFSSVDFGAGSNSCAAPPGAAWSVAAAPGSGYRPGGYSCWYRIDHGNGWMTSYYHLRNTAASGPIARGAATGTIGCEICAGGSADAPHVHFSLLYNGAYVDLDGVALSGWTVHPGNGSYTNGYLKRGNETKQPYDGVYNAGVAASDTTPPEGDYTSPGNGLLVASRTVAMAAWARDGASGVRMVQFTAKWDGTWRVVYRDESAPYAFLWDLCKSGVPDGAVEISLHIQDYASNNFYLGSKNATRHLTKRYDCSAVVAPHSLHMPWLVKPPARRVAPLPR